MAVADPMELQLPQVPLESLPKPRRFGDGPVSGAAVMIVGRVAGFVATFFALAVVARILTPADYGLLAMVSSATAFFSLFADFGLSLVTVQRPTLTSEQMSTLFWINMGFGFFLGSLTSCIAPLLVTFYGDQRLFALTLVVALVFPLTALGTQHEALLKRNMKFRRLVLVRFFSTVCSVAAGVAAALAGWGYWALAVQPLVLAVTASTMFWFAMPWSPGRPRRCEGLSGMLGFGGALTAHGMVGYLANNLDSILIGRTWGEKALGLYNTSCHLMMRPISLAGYGVGEAAIPALSRAASTPGELRPTFRRMFQLTCLLGLPVCFAGAVWTQDLVLTLLGHQWVEAVPVLRLLFIAALPRMLGVCTGWVYVATGRPGRMLSWQLMWTPFIVLAFVLGLSEGAVGVAAAYAIANWIGIIPNYLYCFSGTAILMRDVASSIVRPLACKAFSVLAANGLVRVIPGGAQLHQAGPVRLFALLSVAVCIYVVLVTSFIPMVRERAAFSYRRMLHAEGSM